MQIIEGDEPVTNEEDEAEATRLLEADWPSFVGTPEFTRYKLLLQENFKKNRLLAGLGVQMNDLSVLFHRLELFIDHTLPKDTPARLEMEMAWQNHLRGSQEQIHNEINRQKIAKPAGPRLIVPR